MSNDARPLRGISSILTLVFHCGITLLSDTWRWLNEKDGKHAPTKSYDSVTFKQFWFSQALSFSGTTKSLKVAWSGTANRLRFDNKTDDILTTSSSPQNTLLVASQDRLYRSRTRFSFGSCYRGNGFRNHLLQPGRIVFIEKQKVPCYLFPSTEFRQAIL